ncbi:hypothetical protein BT69DRAFT_2103 [Atractiella rhizophila]|nr:hypothetical protein BT69DRAFT_2103 [Atractiella rhizophila]
MVAIKAFAAFFALASMAVAQFEPLEERASSTAPQFEALEARSMFPSRSTEGHSLSGRSQIHHKRAVNSFYASSYSKYVSDLAGQVASVKSQIQTACKSKGKSSSSTFTKTIHQSLSKCKEHVHKCCGNVHNIPHHPHPSQYPGNPPTIPGCAGQVSSVVIDISDMFDDLKESVKGNAELESLVAGYSQGIDVELADLISSGDSLLSGISSLTQKYTSGFETSLNANGFYNLIGSFHH